MTVDDTEVASAHAHEIVPGDVSGGPSTSQTILVSSLQRLLAELPRSAPPDVYRRAVVEDNVLAKQTTSGREWAFRQLRRFYGLDPSLLLFRALLDLWADQVGQPLIALLCSCSRDPVLRASFSVIRSAEPGESVSVDQFERAIEDAFPGAYKPITRRATAQKVASSWSQSGHLSSAVPTAKARVRAEPTPAALAYALLLGYVQGARGQALFESLWAQMLDQPFSRLSNLAEAASQEGLLEFRHGGGVIEVTFHELLRPFDGKQGVLL